MRVGYFYVISHAGWITLRHFTHDVTYTTSLHATSLHREGASDGLVWNNYTSFHLQVGYLRRFTHEVTYATSLPLHVTSLHKDRASDGLSGITLRQFTCRQGDCFNSHIVTPILMQNQSGGDSVTLGIYRGFQ